MMRNVARDPFRFRRSLLDETRTRHVERMPDTELMRQVQRGSDPAFAELYRRHYRKLLDFFYAMSHDAQTAEDLCHETFIRVWRLRARYTASGKFLSYLFAIARHIWFERRRSLFRDQRITHSVEREPERIAPPPDTPELITYHNELEGRIQAALDQLPEEQRLAFVLRTINGLSLEEIAEIMNCPINTVRSRRLLAVRRLRSLLRGLLVL